MAANIGISVLYENVGAELVSRGLLKKISLEQYHLVHEFNLIWNKSSIPNDQLIPYVDFIRNQLTKILPG